MSAVADADRASWRPSLWLRQLAKTTPNKWPVSRSIRAAIGVGVPVLVGALTGQSQQVMWIAMAAMLLTLGERQNPYASRFIQVAVTAPIVAAAFFLGFLSTTPAVVVIVVMAVFGFATSLASGYSGLLAGVSMPALIISTVSIGIPQLAP